MYLSNIHRPSIGNLANIYRTSVDQLSNLYRISLEHLSYIYSGMFHRSPPMTGPEWVRSMAGTQRHCCGGTTIYIYIIGFLYIYIYIYIDRKATEHRSKIYRSSIERLSDIYRYTHMHIHMHTRTSIENQSNSTEHLSKIITEIQ